MCEVLTDKTQNFIRRAKENGCKLFYCTTSFIKDLPNDYHDKIYVDMNELINKIKEYINGKISDN